MLDFPDLVMDGATHGVSRHRALDPSCSHINCAARSRVSSAWQVATLPVIIDPINMRRYLA